MASRKVQKLIESPKDVLHYEHLTMLSLREMILLWEEMRARPLIIDWAYDQRMSDKPAVPYEIWSKVGPHWQGGKRK